ncbi:hypothetical protein ACLB2K_034813 [Fragaria x ananassa]
MYPIDEAEREESGTDKKVDDIDHLQGQNIRQDEEELAGPARGNIWRLIKIMNLTGEKHFRKQIISVWITFLAYSIVSAAGSTFFYEQMSSLRIPIKNYDIAVYFNVIASLSKHAISSLWEWKIPKETKTRVNTLVRIGCGLACVVTCIATAWRVEIRRLKEVQRQGVGDTSDVVPMSIFRLVPQFSLLGIMEGLLVDGLIDFFVERVAGSDDKVMVEYYASHTSDVVIGVGKLPTALSILAFKRRWFDDTINMSRLDKYYRALTFMSLVGFCYYVCVSTMYYTNADVQESTEHKENETNSHRNEKHESSPPLPHKSSTPSPQEPSQALQDLQQEPQDFLYHQQPPPPTQQQPPPLPPQYYLPPQYPPPQQDHSPEQTYPPATSFQPQPYPPRPYNSYTYAPQPGMPAESYPPQPYQPQTYNSYPTRSGVPPQLYGCTHHSLTRFHIAHSSTRHNNANFFDGL